MNFLLAIFPILAVLGLMLFWRWSGPRAGFSGWMCGLLIALAWFGMNGEVFLVSQLKGLLVTFNVLALLVPALYLYFLVDEVGGVKAIAQGLARRIADRGLLLVTLAWCFGGLVEGLSGYGLPIAIVAPMLVALGVPPLAAVIAPAVGHSWAVTFGGMGNIFQVLTGVTKMDAAALAPWSLAMITLACLGCGILCAGVLGELKRWKAVLGIGLGMTSVLALTVLVGLAPLGSILASVTGILLAAWLGRPRQGSAPTSGDNPRALPMALFAYGMVVVLLLFVSLVPTVSVFLNGITWAPLFPEVSTNNGWLTKAGPALTLRPFTHPGTLLLLSALLSYAVWRVRGQVAPGTWRAAVRRTFRSAVPVGLAVLAMVGLSALMEHSGMTMLLAQGLTSALGVFYPLVSPLVGVLGAFATGSNNSSNVLFAMMQKNVAQLLGVRPEILVSAQTAGGSLGSMLAPAKIMIGCSTTNQQMRVGEVLRRTILPGIGLGLAVGLLALGLAWLAG